MTIWVLRDGEMVEKQRLTSVGKTGPYISRFDTIESPVTGKEITSWRQRDRDMDKAGCVDPRDLPRGPFEQREQEFARRQQLAADATTDAAE